MPSTHKFPLLIHRIKIKQLQKTQNEQFSQDKLKRLSDINDAQFS